MKIHRKTDSETDNTSIVIECSEDDVFYLEDHDVTFSCPELGIHASYVCFAHLRAEAWRRFEEQARVEKELKGAKDADAVKKLKTANPLSAL